jgi:hypothetical protein
MNPLKLLPEYPRTRHLPYKPNAQRLDLIASEEEASIIFNNDNVNVTEKVDGANCGICFYEENFVIRNRSNILQKGKSGHLRTPAKLQFAPIWNWVYENREKFEKLVQLCGYQPTIYGEWLYALHGIQYDALPDYFMAYDLYDWEKSKFVKSGLARKLLSEAGFILTPLLYQGKVPNYEFLEKFMEEKSPFSTLDKREGLYIKVCDDEQVVARFKRVRHDFIQGCRWDERKLTKNRLA